MSEHDGLLVETIARHFPDAAVDGIEIALGFADLRIACSVHSVRALGDYRVASLYFSLSGGPIAAPVFASVSGYGETVEEAIAIGACNWACAFGPVLRAGFAGETQPAVATFEVVVDEQRYRVHVDGLDRGLSLDGSDPNPRMPAARARFAGDSWLARAVLESGRLPLLASDRPTVLSVFVSDLAAKRIVEVKIDGVDWPGMDAAFAAVAAEPEGAMTMLRELAVVVPIGDAAALARPAIERTLRTLATTAAADWPGWQHHHGALAAPLAADPLAALEARVGALPADYRELLARVGGSGAGPGYGLLSPLGDAQLALARGSFGWGTDATPTDDPSGVLALAHAGCGVMWLVVIAGAQRGEVWVDARSSDGKVRRVAPSVRAWYRAWLAAAASGRPWIQWDSQRCATANVLSQILDSLERDGIARDEVAAELPKRVGVRGIMLASAGSPYFRPTAKLNPCHGCIALADSFAIPSARFAPGDELVLEQPVFGARRGWWAKLTGRT